MKIIVLIEDWLSLPLKIVDDILFATSEQLKIILDVLSEEVFDKKVALETLLPISLGRKISDLFIFPDEPPKKIVL